jgi:hypothetical protein
MNECGHTNSVPWMYAIVPKNLLVKLNDSDLTGSTFIGVAAFIHGTEFMWLRKVMVQSWCDHVSLDTELMRFGMQLVWFHKVTLCGFCVHCTLYSTIHLADSRKKSANSPYGVKKICIKWLWPVKVTLEIIKRCPKVFCWSWDENPLKWDKKNLPSLQFVILEWMSLLSPLCSNARLIPLS